MPRALERGVALALVAWLQACAHAPQDGVVPANGEIDWIEVTALTEALVRSREEDRAGRMGHDAATARQRGAAAWTAWTSKAQGGPILEVWIATTCSRCLDLRDWNVKLNRRLDGEVFEPRWIESRVMRQEQVELRVLDATRQVTRSWIKGHLAFPVGALDRDGPPWFMDLLMRRPERWAEPLRARWIEGGAWTDRLMAWIQGIAP